MKNLKRCFVIALVTLSVATPIIALLSNHSQEAYEPTLIAANSMDTRDDNVKTITTPPLNGYTWGDSADGDPDDGNPPDKGGNG